MVVVVAGGKLVSPFARFYCCLLALRSNKHESVLLQNSAVFVGSDVLPAEVMQEPIYHIPGANELEEN